MSGDISLSEAERSAGIVRCDACPVLCRIRPGRAGACDDDVGVHAGQLKGGCVGAALRGVKKRPQQPVSSRRAYAAGRPAARTAAAAPAWS